MAFQSGEHTVETVPLFLARCEIAGNPVAPSDIPSVAAGWREHLDRLNLAADGVTTTRRTREREAALAAEYRGMCAAPDSSPMRLKSDVALKAQRGVHPVKRAALSAMVGGHGLEPWTSWV
jgi:hypothetical protein